MTKPRTWAEVPKVDAELLRERVEDFSQHLVSARDVRNQKALWLHGLTTYIVGCNGSTRYRGPDLDVAVEAYNAAPPWED